MIAAPDAGGGQGERGYIAGAGRIAGLAGKRSRSGRGDSQLQILPVGAASTGRIALSEFSESAYNPRISPDGQWIVHSAEVAGRSEVCVRLLTAEGRSVRITRDGGISGCWLSPGEMS